MAEWRNRETVSPEFYTCGYCGHEVASNEGYRTDGSSVRARICPGCRGLTVFDGHDQHPGVKPGRPVDNVPEDVSKLYEEARAALANNAMTGSVLCCRKLLMNIAVSQGAPEGQKFIEYVDYLEANHFVPPNGRSWVDHIRQKGNEATHEIHLMTKDDALELITFSEMLLKFIYEFPSRVPLPTADSSA